MGKQYAMRTWVLAATVGVVTALGCGVAAADQIKSTAENTIAYTDPETGEVSVSVMLPDEMLAAADVAAVDMDDKTAVDRSVSSFAQSTAYGSCGINVHWPHASNGYSLQIHTRIESLCDAFPIRSNEVSADNYLKRWYGWVYKGRSGPITKTNSYVRLTAVQSCKAWEWHRYKTVAHGTIVSADGRSYSGSSYEQNDNNIQCKP